MSTSNAIDTLCPRLRLGLGRCLAVVALGWGLLSGAVGFAQAVPQAAGATGKNANTAAAATSTITVPAVVKSAVPAVAGRNAAGPLKAELQAFVVASTKEGEKFTKADSVKPGETIEYRVVYRNTSAEELTRLQFDLPIPTSTVWVQDQATPAKPLANTYKGGPFAAMPLTRVVKDKSGVEKRVFVPIKEYRTLRWSLPSLAAGAAFEAKARVRVEDGTDAAR